MTTNLAITALHFLPPRSVCLLADRQMPTNSHTEIASLRDHVTEAQKAKAIGVFADAIKEFPPWFRIPNAMPDKKELTQKLTPSEWLPCQCRAT